MVGCDGTENPVDGTSGGSSAIGGTTTSGGASTSGGSSTSGGTSSTGGAATIGGASPTGGTSSTSGGTSNPSPSGCLLRLGGLPEIAAPSVGDVGDFNHDGLPDVALGPSSGNTIRVLLNQGNGVYADAVTYATDGSANAVSVGDLDGDGILDIVARNSADSVTVSLLKGVGDGTFTLRTAVSAGSDFGSGFPKRNVVVADVTGDGRPDILTAHWDQTISIAAQTSTGAFIRLSPISIGHSATQLAVADLNRDNVPDIVVNHGYSNTTSVLLGTGGGTFATQVDYSLFSASSWLSDSLAIGDVDQDGDPDVVVGNGAGAAIAVLLNSGNGTLSVPTTAINVSGGATYINNVQLTDLEGDGDLDLLVNVSGDGALYYLWNNGTGAFLTTTRDYVANAGISIEVADSNGDGIKDLFLFGNKFLTLLGRGGGKFESQKYLLSMSANPVSVAVGNFDGAGVMDVALANEGANSDGVFLLDANGNYSVPTTYTVGKKPSFVRAADVTGDGKTDLINLNYQDGTINVLKNGGSGTFTVLTPFTVLGFKQWFDLQDVNEDGTLDIVMLEGTWACMSPGTGTGAFGTCSSFTVSNGSAMNAMALGDLNHDGHLDVVAGGPGGSTLNAWLGTGDGKFPTHSAYPTIGSAATSLALGDMNGDRNLDVVVVSRPTTGSSSGMSVYLGDGAGGLAFGTSYRISGLLEQVQIADMNRDGIADVLLVASDTNSLIVMLGVGDGTLSTRATNFFSFPAGESPRDLAVADLNHDGWLDVAVPGYDSASGGVLFGGPPVCPTKVPVP
jgi:hypothetical protein